MTNLGTGSAKRKSGKVVTGDVVIIDTSCILDKNNRRIIGTVISISKISGEIINSDMWPSNSLAEVLWQNGEVGWINLDRLKKVF